MTEKENTPFWQSALVIFAQVTGWIAGPIILALFIGKWLDQKYSSAPWLFLLCIGLAFIISSVGIVRITLDYIKKIEQSAAAPADAKAMADKDKKQNGAGVTTNKY
ncbi:MAG: AtpZ/AtpI family protein [Candidatus Komeilibacteria bacterium]|nr:AtpZ/AtpI family protein [Candidatus Komeilibacteria bacterium]